MPITVFNETPRPPTLEEPSSEAVIELGPLELLFAALALIVVVLLIVFALRRHKDGQEPPRSQTAAAPRAGANAASSPGAGAREPPSGG